MSANQTAARAETHRSTTIVTGPSLTSSTAIFAPKTPVRHLDTELAERRAERLVERLRLLRAGAASVKLGRLPFAVSTIVT